jgi:hypothetical protein
MPTASCSTRGRVGVQRASVQVDRRWNFVPKVSTDTRYLLCSLPVRVLDMVVVQPQLKRHFATSKRGTTERSWSKYIDP